MNHLAHALLGGPDENVVLGSLMGDFVRGAVDTDLPPGVRAGIVLHRAIDSFTDAHARIVATRGLFEPPFRRYAGILIDIWFDHLLARDFSRWSDSPLETFSDGIVATLERHEPLLPVDLRRFTRYLRANGLPANYRHREAIAQALAGVGTRLSRPNPLARGLDAIAVVEPQLQAAFDAFFPQLVEHARVLRSG